MKKIKSVVIAGAYLCWIIGTGQGRIIVIESPVEKQARLPAKKSG